MENLNEVVDLLYKHIRDELTAEESVRLQNWVQQSGENRQFFEDASNITLLLENIKIKNETLQNLDLEKEWQRQKNMGWELPAKPEGKVISFNWRRYTVAASLLVIALASDYLWLRPGKKQPEEIVATPKEIQSDVLPNTKNAVLTLADGTKIILDSAQNGMLATEGGINVVKKANGQLVYEGNPLTDQGLSRAGGSSLIYNTITVPKGSDVVFITLADGSKVWMNAASSIRYPTTFTGNERKVEITGEAYFEVAHNTSKPFYVQKGEMQVQVLGTHFNVNTYEEEGNIRVTLLEGSVKVANKGKSVIIKPGEQAIATANSTAHSPFTIDHTPNVEEVMAWKNGKFVFDNTGLETIMRQIERWYDVEVSYEGNIKEQDITLTGIISRYSNAAKVLDLLQTTGMLYFTIDGKKITVKSAGLH